MTRGRRRLLLGVLLLDAPTFAACAIAGLRWGYADTLNAVLAWRLAHPWTCLPSIAAVALLVARRRRARLLPELATHTEPPR